MQPDGKARIGHLGDNDGKPGSWTWAALDFYEREMFMMGDTCGIDTDTVSLIFYWT